MVEGVQQGQVLVGTFFRTPHLQNDAHSGHTCEQEPSGPGHRTHVHT